jgi:hypothetical protein
LILQIGGRHRERGDQKAVIRLAVTFFLSPDDASRTGALVFLMTVAASSFGALLLGLEKLAPLAGGPR